MSDSRLPVDASSARKEYDALINYCPQLGGEVTFRYCRIVNQNLPCRNVTGCWSGRVDLSSFLSRYSAEQLQRAFALHPRTRLETMLELVEKARKVIE